MLSESVLVNDYWSGDELRALQTRLRAARKAKRLTQEAVARRLGMSRTTLVAIEAGDRPLRLQELIDLSSVYGRSINELLRPTPVTDDFVARFRVSPGMKLEGDQIESCVALLQELADDYLELERLTGALLAQQHPEASFRGIAPAEAAEILAGSERNRLGLGDGPVLELRKLLEADVGLRIFALDLPSRVAGLFINSAVYGACVAMNANHPFERQRWSLAHEFAHFLVHRSRSEITLLNAYQRVPAAERFADAFAENFLMPAVGLRRRFHQVSRTQLKGATPADLLQLADLFQVSFEAMARRLENLGLVRRHAVDKLLNEGFRVCESRELLGIASRPPDSELLPSRFRYLAVDAWTSGNLSEGQLARMLRVDRTTARRLAAELSRRLDRNENRIKGAVETEMEQQLDTITA